MASRDRVLDAARQSGKRIGYAPAIMKETEFLTRSGRQILWLIGERGTCRRPLALTASPG
jgi:hypothetical protein